MSRFKQFSILKRERRIVILFLFALFTLTGQSSWAFSLTRTTTSSSLAYRVSEKEQKSHKVFIQESVEEIEEIEDDGNQDKSLDNFFFVRQSLFFFTIHEYLAALPTLKNTVLAVKKATPSLVILFRNLRN